MNFAEILITVLAKTNREKKLVPAHLVPRGKEVEVKREIKANFSNDTLMYRGENDFTYVDNDAVNRNFEGVMSTWYPH